ncbi:MAG: AsnC family transcriptional regulator [Anaerolineae bacterium]
MDQVDRRLLNLLQSDLPLVERPFAAVGEWLGLSEGEVMARVERLKAEGFIRQISAIFDTRRLGYSSSLVAVKVPEERVDQAAAVISQHPGVSHNYRRDHPFNLWFTIALPPEEDLKVAVERLCAEAGVEAYCLLPTLQLFKIGVKLDVAQEGAEIAGKEWHEAGERRSWGPLSQADKALIRELQEDIEIVSHPFAAPAQRLGVTQEALLARARAMQEAGLIRRFAAVLHHRRAGFSANGMACWRVPEEQIGEVGRTAASFPQVSHCYQRPTYPDWPYNLFTMIHARSKEECEGIAEEISEQTGIDDYIILYSTKEYKKTRVKYFIEG